MRYARLALRFWTMVCEPLAVISVHVLAFVFNFNRLAIVAIANGKTGLYRNPCFCLKRPGMPELRDLYPVGDDEDVAALALYRHMHERSGHRFPRQNELRLNSDASNRPQYGARIGLRDKRESDYTIQPSSLALSLAAIHA